MRPELIIAEKELKDNIASKRFLVILAVLLLLSVYGVYMGMNAYNWEIEQYKNYQVASGQPHMQDHIDSLQKQIQYAEAHGESNESIQYLKNELSSLTNTPMPSILEVFNSMVILFTFLGMALGASMGFDQISGERDEGSLKSLAACPIYRDAIINGKAIGAIATIAVALASAFLIAIAVVMFQGVVPGLDDMARIAALFIFSLLYCSAFFAIAMMTSTFAKNTSRAVIYTIGIIVALILFSILALLISAPLAHAIIGPAPPASYVTINTTDSTGRVTGSLTTLSSEYMSYNNKLAAMRYQVADDIAIISPINDFGGILGIGMGGGIGQAVISKTNVQTYGYAQPASEISLLDSIASVWTKIVVLIVELIVAFSISYVKFMRIDI